MEIADQAQLEKERTTAAARQIQVESDKQRASFTHKDEVCRVIELFIKPEYRELVTRAYQPIETREELDATRAHELGNMEVTPMEQLLLIYNDKDIIFQNRSCEYSNPTTKLAHARFGYSTAYIYAKTLDPNSKHIIPREVNWLSAQFKTLQDLILDRY